MSSSAVFCMSGKGYLHELRQSDHNCFAKIHVIKPTGSHDDVWIECLIDDQNLKRCLFSLNGHLSMQQKPLIEFEIDFSYLDGCQAAILEKVPYHIVFLKGTLRIIRNIDLNGLIPQGHHFYASQMPMVSTSHFAQTEG
jgi:hypothetical protein